MTLSHDEGEQNARQDGEWEGEMMLKENPMRFVLFPINHDAIWTMYKKVSAKLLTLSPLSHCVHTHPFTLIVALLNLPPSTCPLVIC